VKSVPARKPLVSGEILLGSDVRSFSGATVYVRLEDVSHADAAATLVAEQVLRGVSHRARRAERLAFQLPGKSPGGQASYSLRVHVDVDGDGQISPGDYITMESYPVLTHGYPSSVSVRVHRVT
jgi:uncharacterized lipoprotein YbaY